VPSLRTATKLARGLRQLRDDADTPSYLHLVSAGASNPTTRVEYALRADESPSEAHVRQIMAYYLTVRVDRLPRSAVAAEPIERPDRSPMPPKGTVGIKADVVQSGGAGRPTGPRRPIEPRKGRY
jgi:hypothetical protein